jgi:hypothetical protein
MATVITAGNATNGLTFTTDNTGSLDIKTGTGAGTTALSLTSSQIATFAAATSVVGILTAPNLLGQGQTWQSFVGSRVLGTTYTNTTSRPIAVVVNSSAGSTVIPTVNGTAFSSGLTSTASFLVPPGNTYSVTFSAGTIFTWMELR